MIPENFDPIGLRLELILTSSIGLALVLLGVALIIWGFSADGYFAGEGRLISGWVLAVFGALTVVVWLILLIPFQGQYHHLYRVETTVLSVSNVLTEASGDLTRQPVVELDGVDRPVVIDDPRIVNLDGADVTLTCRIAWHYQAADTYACSIYSIDAVRP